MNSQHRSQTARQLPLEAPKPQLVWVLLEPRHVRRSWLWRLRDWLLGPRRSKVYIAIERQ